MSIIPRLVVPFYSGYGSISSNSDETPSLKFFIAGRNGLSIRLDVFLFGVLQGSVQWAATGQNGLGTLFLPCQVRVDLDGSCYIPPDIPSPVERCTHPSEARDSHIAETMVTASFVPTILSILNKSYLEYRTRQVISEASTPSSRKGKERISEKNWG